MLEVNRRAQSIGWQQSVKTLVQPQKPQLYQYIVDHGRADFVYLTPITSSSVVLDVGSGWGAISCLLAARCKHVVSIESVHERVEFLRLRAQQEGLDNIQQIRASFLDLPLPESTFDLIVLNGVVEWIGVASFDDRPDVLQHQVLTRLKQCLKPGGCLYIGIENRFGYRYFLGAHDHTGLPYTSLLPRRLADIVMRRAASTYRTVQGGNAYRTYTYSYWGYKSLLRQAGFTDIEVYAVFPDYNDPSFLVPLGDQKAFSYLARRMYAGNTRKRQLLRAFAALSAPLGLHRLFSPFFGILATRM